MSCFFTDGIVVTNSVKLLFNHPQGTHDDRFWAVSLAVHVAEQAPPPPLSAPIGKDNIKN